MAEQYTPQAQLAISGSAGMGMAESVQIPFVQEVYATRVAAGRLAPGTDCIIELGGEDAKILFLTNGVEVRMNGSCAGGTGAFIDQMATLLKMGADEMDIAAQKRKRPILLLPDAASLPRAIFNPSSTRVLRHQTLPPAFIRRW